ncbi:MAG: hypothetical protein KGK16_14775 [Bradyrhizobium sp.]|nr:hypothetical protein [Bradyrhizobium sp.]
MHPVRAHFDRAARFWVRCSLTKSKIVCIESRVQRGQYGNSVNPQVNMSDDTPSPWYKKIKARWIVKGAILVALVLMVFKLNWITGQYRSLAGKGNHSLTIENPSVEISPNASSNPEVLKWDLVTVTISKADNVAADKCRIITEVPTLHDRESETQTPFDLAKPTTQVRKARPVAVPRGWIGKDVRLFVECDGAVSNVLTIKLI